MHTGDEDHVTSVAWRDVRVAWSPTTTPTSTSTAATAAPLTITVTPPTAHVTQSELIVTTCTTIAMYARAHDAHDYTQSWMIPITPALHATTFGHPAPPHIPSTSTRMRIRSSPDGSCLALWSSTCSTLITLWSYSACAACCAALSSTIPFWVLDHAADVVSLSFQPAPVKGDNVSEHGCMDVWMYGCMDVMYGCTDVWMCAMYVM